MSIKTIPSIFLFCFLFLNAFGQTNYSSTYESIPVLNFDGPKSIIPSIDVPFESRYTPVVESYLKTYFSLKREHSKDIVGRAVIYFPLFEKVLKENNMPESLKYLAITESALKLSLIHI